MAVIYMGIYNIFPFQKSLIIMQRVLIFIFLKNSIQDSEAWLRNAGGWWKNGIFHMFVKSY